MGWINEETIISGLKLLDQIIAIYVIYRIAKYLIKFGINYFLEKSREYEANCSKEKDDYYKMSLTQAELDEISLALKARIESVSKKIEEVQSPEAKEVLAKTLQECIAAQKQTTYAGQPEEYQYQE